MKEVTKLMIKKFALMKLKYDFMGYTFRRIEELSYHHLIIPKKNGGEISIKNGSILKRDTSHNYLHLIEIYDPEIFLAITSEMIDENMKGYLDMQNLIAINDMLNQFEKEYCSTRNDKGKLIIKEEYTKRLLNK